MPTYRDDLDARFAHGCSTPDCQESHDALFLAAGCHPATGLRARWQGERPLLALTCPICARPVCEIVVVERQSLASTCGHGRKVDARYQHGHLTIQCRSCARVRCTLAVAEREGE
jgi:hypothetical protein